MKRLLAFSLALLLFGSSARAQQQGLTEDKLFAIIGRLHTQIVLLTEENARLKAELQKATEKPQTEIQGDKN